MSAVYNFPHDKLTMIVWEIAGDREGGTDKKGETIWQSSYSFAFCIRFYQWWAVIGVETLIADKRNIAVSILKIGLGAGSILRKL